ncbi:hypothetical protein TNCV_4431401 [Trichonephila clavipes]|nr:hypothetical protein TNCV_4431401 [Trichonephila clavipes]
MIGKNLKESGDVIYNIPVNPDIDVAKDGTEWISLSSNIPGRFTTQMAKSPSVAVFYFAERVASAHLTEARCQ